MDVTDKPKVSIVGYTQTEDDKLSGVEEIPVAGAMSCFSQESGDKIVEDLLRQDKPEREKQIEKILAETSGRGHGAVLDQADFVFSLENVPRLATLFLCAPEYLMHLQQSLRRATADRGFQLPKAILDSSMHAQAEALLNDSFDVYEKLKEMPIIPGKDKLIPAEDARYVLPLFTRTNIVTKGDVRELMHLHDMSRRQGMPSIIKGTVQEMIDIALERAPRLMKERDNNYQVRSWYPSSQLFAAENRTIEELITASDREDVLFLGGSGIPMSAEAIKKAIVEKDEAELANLKHIHYTFLVSMSLASFHQMTRQRTLNQSVESIYHAATRGSMVLPPSISKNEEAENKFLKTTSDMFWLYQSLIRNGIPQEEAAGVLPHSLAVYDLLHVNGWQVPGFIATRTCTEAQWEIRDKAQKIAEKIREVNPALGKYAVPRGIMYGKCPERNSCHKCDGKSLE